MALHSFQRFRAEFLQGVVFKGGGSDVFPD
jgi:hypothetical protein